MQSTYTTNNNAKIDTFSLSTTRSNSKNNWLRSRKVFKAEIQIISQKGTRLRGIFHCSIGIESKQWAESSSEEHPPNPNDSTWKSTELFTEPQWKLASSQAKDFIRSMLDPDPCSRITADEALEHNWITNADNNNSNVINHNNSYYCEHLAKKPKHDSIITLDLDLLCNTSTDFVVDSDDIIASDDTKFGLVWIYHCTHSLNRLFISL